MNNRELAQRCREQANERNIDNKTAILLILAAKELEKQADRLLKLSKAFEQMEAKNNKVLEEIDKMMKEEFGEH